MADWSRFLKGFLDEGVETIGKRKDEADKYLQEQMELARTVGMQNRQKMQQMQQTGISAAKQLQSVGVPKDLVLAIAQQNPDDIPTFLSQVQKLQENGVNTDESFFRDLIQVSGDVDPNASIEEVFSRIYEPLSTQAKADPRAVNDDPWGAMWATATGRNAMDRARTKLETTEIIDGLSAQDLLNYQQFQPNVGNSTVVMNAGFGGAAMRDADFAQRQAYSEPDELSINSRAQLSSDFEDRFVALRESWEMQQGEGFNESAAYTPEVEANLRRQAADSLTEVYSSSDLQEVPAIAKWLNGSSQSPVEAPPIASPPPQATTPPESVVAPVRGLPEAPVAAPVSEAVQEPPPPAVSPKEVEEMGVVDTPQGPMPAKLPIGEEVYLKPHPTRGGHSIWLTKDGKQVVMKDSMALMVAEAAGWQPPPEGTLSPTNEFDFMNN